MRKQISETIKELLTEICPSVELVKSFTDQDYVHWEIHYNNEQVLSILNINVFKDFLLSSKSKRFANAEEIAIEHNLYLITRIVKALNNY